MHAVLQHVRHHKKFFHLINGNEKNFFDIDRFNQLFTLLFVLVYDYSAA